MTSTKAALISALTRTDSPRRETLRRELARAKPTGRRAGLEPKLVLASASPRSLTLLGQVGT
jgi:nucleoside triphosphate pyrophosphatase